MRNQSRFVYLIRHFMHDNGFFILTNFFNSAFCTHHNRTAAGQISLLGSAVAQNQAAGRKIRSRNNINQFFNADFRIIYIGTASINHFTQIMRRNVCCHTNGNTVAAVYQQVRKTRRQNCRFLQRFIIVWHKVNSVFVQIVGQTRRNFSESGFGITHSSSAITIHRAKVTLSVNQCQTHRKRLRHTHHGFINRDVAVRVIFTHNIADDTRRFTIWFGAVITVFIHSVNNTAMHRFHTVTSIRQSTGYNHAHGIVQI